MYLLFGFILIVAVFSGIFLILKGNSRKSFYLVNLGVNLIIIPFSFFMGVFEANTPGSDMFDFFKGFLFVQLIPLILFIISILRMLINFRKSKKSAINATTVKK